MVYYVRITEVRVIVVPVEANSMAEAKVIAERSWNNGEYTKDYDYARPSTQRATFETLYPEYPQSVLLHTDTTNPGLARVAAQGQSRRTRRAGPEL